MAEYSRVTPDDWVIDNDTADHSRVTPAGWEIVKAPAPGGSVVGPGLLSSPLLFGRLLRGLVR